MAKVNLGRDSSGRPLVISRRTKRMLDEVAANLGFRMTVVQGSYRGSRGARASAGTHDKAGVIDLRTWNLPGDISPQDAVRSLRRHGFVAWYRTRPAFDPHIHAIDLGCKNLAPSAARQVLAWRQGRNGLASNGPDDGRPRKVSVWKKRKPRKKRRPETVRDALGATRAAEADAKGKPARRRRIRRAKRSLSKIKKR